MKMDIRYLKGIIILFAGKKKTPRRPAMSSPSITPYFPFRRIQIINQTLFQGAVHIEVTPDRRFQPICHVCGQPSSGIHSWTERAVRDLNLACTRVWLLCPYRKIFCFRCQRIVTEDLGLFHPYFRVTVRLAQYIHELCKLMTVKEAAEHVGIDWKTVKTIDKLLLEQEYGQPNYNGFRILAVDEISVRKGHRYLTVVLDYLTGRVVWT
jgi:transposase